MNILFIFIVAISLSMDAFSLSLAYGTNNLSLKEINMLSIIVGIYHFFMPIFGMLIGEFIEHVIHLQSNFITLIIFIIIGINMILESFKKDQNVKKMKIVEMIFFGFAVSIDSFSVGIGIKNISNNFILCSCVFSVISFSFTYVGLYLGDKLAKLIGKIATLMGGIVLIILGIVFVI